MDKKRVIQPVVFAVIVYIIWEIIGNVSAYLLTAFFNKTGIVLPSDYWNMFISEMCVWLLSCIVFWKYIKDRGNLSGECLVKYIWVLLPVVLQVSIDICTLFSGDIVINLLSAEGISFLIPCFLGTMSIGLLEETIWRKVIFLNTVRKWGDSQKGIICAVIFPVLLFGLCHYMNMLSAGQGFYDTSKQVLSSICMGVFLSGIYYRTGKFIVPVIIHGLCNFSNFFMNEMLGWDYNLLKFSGILQVAVSVLYLFLGIYMALCSDKYKNIAAQGAY